MAPTPYRCVVQSSNNYLPRAPISFRAHIAHTDADRFHFRGHETFRALSATHQTTTTTLSCGTWKETYPSSTGTPLSRVTTCASTLPCWCERYWMAVWLGGTRLSGFPSNKLPNHATHGYRVVDQAQSGVFLLCERRFNTLVLCYVQFSTFHP